jgi:hypothetical protein
MTIIHHVYDDRMLEFEIRKQFIRHELIQCIKQGVLMVLALGVINLLVIFLYYYWSE